MSDSLRLVEFTVRLVDFVLHLPGGQVNVLGKVFEEIQISVLSTVILWGHVRMTFRLVHHSYSMPKPKMWFSLHHARDGG